MWKLLILLVLTSVLQAQDCSDLIPKTTPDSRFVIHNNGTVTDKETNLMWQRCLQGKNDSDFSCPDSSAWKYTWQEALQMSKDDRLAGYNNWRVPNIKELASIIERSCYNQAININIFPNIISDSVWSSTPLPAEQTDRDGIYQVSFTSGMVLYSIYDEKSYRYVRFVRN